MWSHGGVLYLPHYTSIPSITPKHHNMLPVQEVAFCCCRQEELTAVGVLLAAVCHGEQTWLQMLEISVADPDPGSGAFLTRGSGMGRSQHPDPGSGMNNPDHIF
jgi:hypothetical protein